MSVFTDSAAVQHEAPLVPLALPARRRTSWSPWLLRGHCSGCRQFWGAPQGPSAVKASRSGRNRQATPRFAYKYLSLNYLARGLNTAERASCFLHHYGRLSSTLPGRFLHRVENGYLALHEIRIDDNRFTISMGISKYFDMEGRCLSTCTSTEKLSTSGLHHRSWRHRRIRSGRSDSDFAPPGHEGFLPRHPPRHQVAA